MENIHGKIVVSENELTKNYTAEIRSLKKSLFKELALLWNEKNFNKIIEYGIEKIKELPTEAQGEGDKEIFGIYYLIGSAMRELKYDKEEITYFAIKSAHFDRLSKNAMWLLRDIKSEFSDNSKYFMVEVKGAMYLLKDDIEKEEIFFAVYGVVSETVEEAMDYIREFERPEVKDSLELFASKESDSKPDLPKGIYKNSPLIANAELIKDSDESKN